MTYTKYIPVAIKIMKVIEKIREGRRDFYIVFQHYCYSIIGFQECLHHPQVASIAAYLAIRKPGHFYTVRQAVELAPPSFRQIASPIGGETLERQGQSPETLLHARQTLHVFIEVDHINRNLHPSPPAAVVSDLPLLPKQRVE